LIQSLLLLSNQETVATDKFSGHVQISPVQFFGVASLCATKEMAAQAALGK
jgi:hypothetical protein